MLKCALAMTMNKEADSICTEIPLIHISLIDILILSNSRILSAFGVFPACQQNRHHCPNQGYLMIHSWNIANEMFLFYWK